MLEMNVIVAVDRNWGIGFDGKLLFSLPGDMEFFKGKTLGAVCIMGRKTFNSLPHGPLHGRINCVLTRDEKFAVNNPYINELIVADSPRKMIMRIGEKLPIYIIGGGEIYREFLPLVSTCYVTKINASLEADTWFPNLDTHPDFELVGQSDDCLEKEIEYRFCEYRRIPQTV